MLRGHDRQRTAKSGLLVSLPRGGNWLLGPELAIQAEPQRASIGQNPSLFGVFSFIYAHSGG
jgi:hypothetical protein